LNHRTRAWRPRALQQDSRSLVLSIADHNEDIGSRRPSRAPPPARPKPGGQRKRSRPTPRQQQEQQTLWEHPISLREGGQACRALAFLVFSSFAVAIPAVVPVASFEEEVP